MLVVLLLVPVEDLQSARDNSQETKTKETKPTQNAMSAMLEQKELGYKSDRNVDNDLEDCQPGSIIHGHSVLTLA